MRLKFTVGNLGLFLTLGLTLGTAARAESFGGITPFPEFGHQTTAAVWRELKSCGLLNLSAIDPRLPLPAVPASRAVVNRRGQLLAYFFENYEFGYFAEFKNPNGGLSHSLQFTNHALALQTPYVGTVAHANTFATPAGVGVNAYCRSYPTSWEGLKNCAHTQWVTVIARQLCRFAN